MKLEKIKEILDKTGYHVAYDHFDFDEDDKPNPPFIVYREGSSNNIFADNIIFKKVNTVDVILYTKIKDLNAEKNLEDKIKLLRWNSRTDYDDKEKLYEKIYELEEDFE